jgi:7-cyano-7-deazaguanine synthase
MKAVCLLSGGLDSCIAAAIAANKGYEIYALSFDYGQRHRRELESAIKIAKFLKAKEHKTIKCDLREIGGSALTDDIDVPERKEEDISASIIPITYVPARNTIFLSYALAYAEVIKADAIFIGANSIDYSGYPDCRPEYFKAYQSMADLATKRGVEGNLIKIETPLINLTKAEIIKKGIELNAPLELTWSCYKGKEKACGKCDSCLLRLKGFREAGYEDPIEYE